MSKRNRRVRGELWIILMFIALVTYALIADWWEQNSVLGWVIIGVLVVVAAFLIYRFASIRGWLGRQVKTAAEKAIYEPKASPREPLPRGKREEVLERALNRCENDSCNQRVKPVIHHIDGNNSHNQLSNLIALCPNCHQEAHDGVFTERQLRNWVKRDYQRLKARRATS